MLYRNNEEINMVPGSADQVGFDDSVAHIGVSNVQTAVEKLSESLSNFAWYNPDDDYMYIGATKWMFAGLNSMFLFKPNEGLKCEYEKSSYANVTVTTSSIDIYSTDTSQRPRIGFNVNLSGYVNKGKKIRVTYRMSTTGSSPRMEGNTSPLAGSGSINAQLEDTTSVKTVEIALDSVITETNPYLAFSWVKSGTAVHMYISELAIVS